MYIYPVFACRRFAPRDFFEKKKKQFKFTIHYKHFYLLLFFVYLRHSIFATKLKTATQAQSAPNPVYAAPPPAPHQPRPQHPQQPTAEALTAAAHIAAQYDPARNSLAQQQQNQDQLKQQQLQQLLQQKQQMSVSNCRWAIDS